MFALVQQAGDDAPWLVHDLFEDRPELHPDLAQHLHDVSGVPGLDRGWELLPDGSFVPFVPALDAARAERVRRLRFDCLHAITGGFTSTALGQPHHYGSTDTDQTNIGRALRASLTRSKDPAWTAAVPCRAAGEDADAFRPHTAAQLHALECDLHDVIEGARVRLDKLKAQVAQAPTVDIVNAIAW